MVNYGSAGAGAISGATTGAALGGPWGAVAGGVLGGVGGLFDKSAKKDQFKQISTQTPEQQKFLASIFPQLQGGPAGQNYGLSQDYLHMMMSGDPQAYQNWAAPYQTQFEQQTIPMLAERFAGMGGGLGGGVMGSSGFGQAIGGAGAQFQSNLAGIYAQLQQQAAQQAISNYFNLANMGLNTRAFETGYQPGSTGMFGNIASGIAGGIGQGAGLSMGNQFQNMFNKTPAPQAQQ